MTWDLFILYGDSFDNKNIYQGFKPSVASMS